MSESFIGEIRLFPLSWTPEGWLPCDGRAMQVSQNQALFSLIFNWFGGDGQQTFFLPDLRGRTIIGQTLRSVTGLSTYRLGDYGGVEAVTLTADNQAPHTHNVVGDNANGQTLAADDNYLAVPNLNGQPYPLYNSGTTPVALNPASVSTVGGGAPHDNMQPYQALGYFICTVGYYPTRP